MTTITLSKDDILNIYLSLKQYRCELEVQKICGQKIDENSLTKCYKCIQVLNNCLNAKK